MTPCTRCVTPIEDGDLRCAVCALPVAVAIAAPDKARSYILRCTECGAAVAFDANKQAPACAFCRAVMTVEQPVDPIEVATLRVPFAVERERATRSLRVWLGRRGYFAPKTLEDEAVFESLEPLCWAAWIVTARAAVSWTADSDAGSRRSSWAPYSGIANIDFGDIVVPASRGLRTDECSALAPYYDLGTIVPIGDGEGEDRVMTESFDAQRSAARDQVRRAIHAVAKARVKPHVPGNRVRNLHVSCLLQGQTTERVALPAWVLAYRYRGSPYRAIVHGQRADLVFGTSPTDWRKVMWLVVGLAALALAIAVIVFALR
jgi:hypothetical protein